MRVQMGSTEKIGVQERIPWISRLGEEVYYVQWFTMCHFIVPEGLCFREPLLSVSVWNYRHVVDLPGS